MKARAQRYTILVVEDEPAVLLTYRMILEQHGYDVVTAASALEARQAIAAHLRAVQPRRNTG